ncbi:MAG: LemA family protein [Candidatus Bipolaricaulia bacterium]
MALWIIVGIIVIGLIWAISVYNRMIRLRVRAEEAWRDVDTQLKRRYDLIPNLVNTVKGYAKHEREVFDQVSEARSRAIGAPTPGEQAEAENLLTGALRQLFAVAEAYPELKANENFLGLQQTLGDVESDIQKSRRFYNAVVRDLNIVLQVFPNNILAGIFGFTEREFFELTTDEERMSVEVSFEPG